MEARRGQGGNASSHDSEAPQSRCLVEPAVPHCCAARAGSAPWDPWERGEGRMQSPPGTGTGAACPLGFADGFMEHLEPPVPRCSPLVPPLRGVWGGTSCSCPEKGLCCFQGKSEDRAEGRSPSSSLGPRAMAGAEFAAQTSHISPRRVPRVSFLIFSSFWALFRCGNG